MTPLPPLLMARTPEEAVAQARIWRALALARALHGSSTAPVHHVPQSKPNASAPASAGEAALVQRERELGARVEQQQMQWEIGAGLGDVTARTRAYRNRGNAKTALAQVRQGLDWMGRGREGKPNLWLVHIPPYRLQRGQDEAATFALPPRQLDTHTLPEPLRARLDAYLLSGRCAAPWRYFRWRCALYPTDRVSEDVRELMLELERCLSLC